MIKGLHFVKSARAGKPVKWFVYAYRGGPLIMKADGEKKPHLTDAALEAYRESRISIKGGTIAALIYDWHQSVEWIRLADSTKLNWRRIVNQIENKWGETPLSIWSDPRMVVKVIAWRDEASATPRTADYQITVLCSMLEWARLHGRVKVNVASHIPRIYEGGNRAEIIWTREDRLKFATVAPQCVTDGLELACMTGLRLGDLVSLTWDEVGDHSIVKLAAKASKGKRRRVTIPLTPEAHELLAVLKTRPRAAGVNTVLTNVTGRQWTAGAFGKRVGEARNKAGIYHTDGRAKHLHDCRGTNATVLIKAGLTNEEVGRILGWSPERVSNIRSVYVDDARIVVALAERIAAASDNPSVKHTVKQRVYK